MAKEQTQMVNYIAQEETTYQKNGLSKKPFQVLTKVFIECVYNKIKENTSILPQYSHLPLCKFFQETKWSTR